VSVVGFPGGAAGRPGPGFQVGALLAEAAGLFKLGVRRLELESHGWPSESDSESEACSPDPD
jgi:hypothetical protein